MNFKTLWAGKRTRIALIAGAGLLVAVAAFVIAGAADDTPGWVPAPFSGARETANSNGESLDGTSTAKASAPNVKPVSNGNAPSASDTNDDSPTDPNTSTDTTGVTPANPPATNPPSEKPAAKTMTVRILYWNDTESKPAASLIVSIGDAKWSPADKDAKSAVGSLAGLPFNQSLKIVVMPDGVGGKRIEVPVKFTTDMIANTAGDAIHVEVKDGTVRVLGTPVDNFDVTLDRF